MFTNHKKKSPKKKKETKTKQKTQQKHFKKFFKTTNQKKKKFRFALSKDFLTSSVQGLNIFIILQHIQGIYQNILLFSFN